MQPSTIAEPISIEVRALRQSFIGAGVAPSYFQINNGLCEDFAIDLVARLAVNKITAVDICNENFMTGEDGDECGNDVWDWALLAKHWGIAPPAGTTAVEIDQIDFGGHVWIAIGRRHYDAECPDGVESFFDLPLFRRYIVKHLRTNGVPADDVYVDDVIQAPLCPVPNPTHPVAV